MNLSYITTGTVPEDNDYNYCTINDNGKAPKSPVVSENTAYGVSP